MQLFISFLFTSLLLVFSVAEDTTKCCENEEIGLVTGESEMTCSGTDTQIPKNQPSAFACLCPKEKGFARFMGRCIMQSECPECRGHERFFEHGVRRAEATCDDVRKGVDVAVPMPTANVLEPGCYCSTVEGFVRNEAGECIPMEKCFGEREKRCARNLMFSHTPQPQGDCQGMWPANIRNSTGCYCPYLVGLVWHEPNFLATPIQWKT
ncbi:hypothetical protein QR680_011638 [Steinernema hermaphroditum]|uniref:TIL domain-containing protein n=1 Tax=Steinernema hermaphroditum TaxID=289476 RepID=A0AA39LYF1_9BILA|nr:hypothetical protein QR680_011638 [Steinernema hermaphroditum]